MRKHKFNMNKNKLKELFTQDDIDYINNLQDTYSHILNYDDNYKKYSIKISDLIDEEEKNENWRKESKVIELEQLHCFTNPYECCLFYYLGLVKGIKLNNIK